METPEQLAARLALENQVRALPRFFDDSQAHRGVKDDRHNVNPSIERLRSSGEWKICDPETGQQMESDPKRSPETEPHHGTQVNDRSRCEQERPPALVGHAHGLNVEAKLSGDRASFKNAWDEVQKKYQSTKITNEWSKLECVHHAVKLLQGLTAPDLNEDEIGSAVLSLLQLEYRLLVMHLKSDNSTLPDNISLMMNSRKAIHCFLSNVAKSWSGLLSASASVGAEAVYQCVRCCMMFANVIGSIEVEQLPQNILDYKVICSGDIEIVTQVLKLKDHALAAAHSKSLKWLGSMLDRSSNLTTLIEVVFPSGVIEALCEIFQFAEKSRSPGGRISAHGRDLGRFSIFALSAFMQPDGNSWGPLLPFPILCMATDRNVDLKRVSMPIKHIKQLYRLRVKVHGEVANQLVKSGIAELMNILEAEINDRCRQRRGNSTEPLADDEDDDDDDEDQSLLCCVIKILVHACRSSAALSRKLVDIKLVRDSVTKDVFSVIEDALSEGVLRTIETYFTVDLLCVLLRRDLLSKSKVWHLSLTIYPIMLSTRNVAVLSGVCTFFSDVIESETATSSASTSDRESMEHPVALDVFDLIISGALSSECFQAVLRLFQVPSPPPDEHNDDKYIENTSHQLTCYHVRAQGMMDSGIVLLLRAASKVTKQVSGQSPVYPERNTPDDVSLHALKKFTANFTQVGMWETLEEVLSHGGYGILSPWGLFCLLKLLRLVREMQCNSSITDVDGSFNIHLLPQVINLLDCQHIECLIQWPDVIGGGGNAVKALIHAIVKVLGIPFMHSVPEDLLVSTQEVLYDAKCIDKLLGVLQFVCISVRDVHLEASVLELPVSFLSRLVASSAHFGSQFVESGGIRVIKECGILKSSSSPSLLIDTLLILSQLARTSEHNYTDLLELSILSALHDLVIHPEAMVRAKVLNCIGNLCRHSTIFYAQLVDHSLVATRSASILDLVVESLDDEDGYVRRFACFVIGNAAFHNSSLYNALRPAIPALMYNLEDREDKTRSNAAGALGNLVRNSSDLCEELCAHQAPLKLFQIALVDPSTASRRIVLFSLGNFCVYPQCFIALRGVEPQCIAKLERLHDEVVGDEVSRKNIRRIIAKIDGLIDQR